MMKIKDQYTHDLIFKSEVATTMKEAVEEAVKAGINLEGTNLQGTWLVGANLQEANLQGINLQGAFLARAHLRDAGLVRAHLGGACLRDANLQGANLEGAYLLRANLIDADLQDASLEGAHLQGACLVRANLAGTNLRGASFEGASLRGAAYPITALFLADWGRVSDEVCGHLMRLDALAIPRGLELMREWAEGEDYPLSQTGGIDRIANFQERRDAWNEELPPKTLWEIWQMLAAEKEVEI